MTNPKPTAEMTDQIIKIVAKGLREAFSMGLKQSPFDAENSEFYLPLLDLTKAPAIAAEINAAFEEKMRSAFEAGREYQMGLYSEYHGGHESEAPGFTEWYKSNNHNQ